MLIQNGAAGFPGGAVVEGLPANAGDTGSRPGLGGSHMPRSDWAREPQLLSLRVWSLCSATREAAIVRGPRTAMKSGPHLPQLERALARKRGPNTAIKKKKKKMVKPLWKTIWKFFKNLKVKLPYDPAIPLLGIYQKGLKSRFGRDISSSILLCRYSQ